MTIEHPIEDEVGQLARRVEKARGRLAYQFDPALTEALSEDELLAERELAERIRGEDRAQRWKHVQAAASAADRARQTTEAIEKADIRDLLVARKAIAAQRRESSPHAKLASLYRHRGWSLRALAGVVGAGMLWSAVNVQHNIAPGGPGDPLYWFSYLIEAMISVCLIIIMIGTNKVAEWGVIDNRRQVATAEIALLSLTVILNTYPYLRDMEWYEAGVHAVAPVMIGVALLIHDAASARYGLAIYRATEQVRELPDPAEQIRRTQPNMSSYRANALAALVASQTSETSTLEATAVESDSDADEALDVEEVAEEDEPAEPAEAPEPTGESTPEPQGPPENSTPETNGAQLRPATVKTEKRRAPSNANSRAVVAQVKPPQPVQVENASAATTSVSKPAVAPKEPVAPVVAKNNPFAPAIAETATAPMKAETKPVPKPESAPVSPPKQAAAKTTARKAAPATADKPSNAAKAAGLRSAAAPVTAINRQATAPDARKAAPDAMNGKEKPSQAEPDPTHLQVVRTPDNIHDTGQFRIAEMLEQELAELQAERRRARASRQR